MFFFKTDIHCFISFVMCCVYLCCCMACLFVLLYPILCCLMPVCDILYYFVLLYIVLFCYTLFMSFYDVLTVLFCIDIYSFVSFCDVFNYVVLFVICCVHFCCHMLFRVVFYRGVFFCTI